MKNQTVAETIELMQKQFARWGIPDEIVTDCGKNYDSVEFTQFCEQKKDQTYEVFTTSPSKQQ